MLKAIGWTAYGLLGLTLTIIFLVDGNLWFALAVALAFIFGPKVWKSL